VLALRHTCSVVVRLTRAALSQTRRRYGLQWSSLTPGRLLSGGDDNMVCIWDVALGSSAKGGVLQPLQTLTSHTAVVEVTADCVLAALPTSVRA
jgi:hypothetical protein